MGSEKTPHPSAVLGPGSATTSGQAGVGNRKSAHTGEVLNTPEAVERHKAAAQAGGAAGNGQSATREGSVSLKDAKAQSGEGKAEAGGQRPEDGGQKTDKQVAVPPPDIMAFNTRLYEAMERDKITEVEITGYLNGTSGKPRIARPVLAGNMTIHNLGERIADALVSGTDKEGKSNWETVVGRIRADRK